jgi:hypothetical protein
LHCADVVDAVIDNRVLNAAALQHISTEASFTGCARVADQIRSTDALIHDGHVLGRRIALQARRQNVRPAVAPVRIRTSTVGDRIANRDQRFCGRISVDIMPET